MTIGAKLGSTIINNFVYSEYFTDVLRDSDEAAKLFNAPTFAPEDVKPALLLDIKV